MRSAAVAALGAAALLLTACGSETVENSAPSETSVAPLERAPSLTESASATVSEEASASVAPGAPAAPQPQDQPGREVDSIPPQAQDYTPEEQIFLDAVAKAGINVKDAEGSIIGAGRAACTQEDKVTIPAVAGQLVEQQRTAKPYDEVVGVLESNARTAFCQAQ